MSLHGQKYDVDPAVRAKARIAEGYAQQRHCGHALAVEQRLNLRSGMQGLYSEMQRAAYQQIEDARLVLKAIEE